LYSDAKVLLKYEPFGTDFDTQIETRTKK